MFLLRTKKKTKYNPSSNNEKIFMEPTIAGALAMMINERMNTPSRISMVWKFMTVI